MVIVLLSCNLKHQVLAEAPLHAHGKSNNIKTMQDTAFHLQINLPKEGPAGSLQAAQRVEQHTLVSLWQLSMGKPHITKATPIISLALLEVSLYVSFPALQRKKHPSKILFAPR